LECEGGGEGIIRNKRPCTVLVSLCVSGYVVFVAGGRFVVCCIQYGIVISKRRTEYRLSLARFGNAWIVFSTVPGT
jgi:hypothetical protein